MEAPVRVGGEEARVDGDHLRLDPEAEADALGVHVPREPPNAVGKLRAVHLW